MQRWMVALLLLIFGGCTIQKDENTEQIVELQFNFDPDLVGREILLSEYGIRFHPPKTWIPLSQELFNQAAELIDRNVSHERTYTYRPVSILTNEQNGSMLIVTELLSRDQTARQRIHIAEYCTDIAAALTTQHLQTTRFMKDGIYFYQFLIQQDGVVNFKFVFEAGDHKILQFDYVVPHAVYHAESKAIESSIGSIHVADNY